MKGETVSRNRRTDEELREIAGILLYEKGMMFYTASSLASEQTDHLLRNALLESFVIHARNLIAFIWSESSNSDDVLAEDFFPDPQNWRSARPEMSTLLSESKRRVNKLAAHLTYTRLSISGAQKVWRFIDIARELQTVFELFVQSAPQNTVQVLTENSEAELTQPE